jgi:hypothetical protein
MNAQEPRIEERATWGDVVGAIIACAICFGAVALTVTFVDMRPSALTSVDAHSSLLSP